MEMTLSRTLGIKGRRTGSCRKKYNPKRNFSPLTRRPLRLVMHNGKDK